MAFLLLAAIKASLLPKNWSISQPMDVTFLWHASCMFGVDGACAIVTGAHYNQSRAGDSGTGSHDSTNWSGVKPFRVTLSRVWQRVSDNELPSTKESGGSGVGTLYLFVEEHSIHLIATR